MPTYVITAPDGKELEITAPEGATQDEVLAYAQANYSPTQQQQIAKEEPSMGSELARGAKLAGRALVEGLSTPANIVGDFLSGAYNLGAQALGTESRVPTLSSIQQQGFQQMGAPEPKGMAEKALTGGIQALAGGLGTNLIAGGAKAAAPLVANTPEAVSALAAGGASAPLTYQLAKDYTGSDLAASMASLGMSAIAAGAAGKLTGTVTSGSSVPKLTMEEVKQRATRSYRAVEDAGITVKPKSALDMVSTMRKSLEDANYLPQDPAQAKIAATLNKFEEIIGTQRVSFSKVEQMRTLANDIKASSDRNVSRLGSIMVDNIDNYVANISNKDVLTGSKNVDDAIKNLRNARNDWRNLSRATTLEDALNVAQVKADNPTASQSELIRQGFINIAKDKNKMKLFTPDEQAAIRRVTAGIPLDTTLSMLAKFNPERSKLVLGGGLYGASSGNVPLMALAAGGYSADKLQQLMRTRQANQVISDILNQTTESPSVSQAFRGLFSVPQQ